MGYAAIALAILGISVGVVFRLKILLAILALLLVVSIVFSFSRSFNFLDTALMIMVVQTVIQCSYFLGLVISATFIAAHRGPSSDITPLDHNLIPFYNPNKTFRWPRLSAQGTEIDRSRCRQQ
jgi:hypothetical protein